MGFKEMYNKARTILAKDIRLFNAESTAQVNNMPFLPSWFWTAKLGMPRKVDYYELRQCAKAPWVQMVKAAIKKQVMTIDWDVVNSDEEDETDFREQIAKVKTLLEQPNRNGQTFGELWSMFLDDVLDIDAGVIYKGHNSSGELVELFAHDGAKFLFDVEEHGLVQGFYQYSYKFPTQQPRWFDKKDIIYGKIGFNTDQFPYGWSPLQSIQQVIELMIQSDRYNKEFFKNNAMPDGIVSAQMDKEALKRLKWSWENEVKGKPHKLLFLNGDTDFKQLSLSNKDMEWLEGQKWYFHVVFAAYGLSPQEVGFYENSNRSTGESQERVSVKNAIKPYLKLIEDKINMEIIPEIVGHDDIKFVWFPKDDAAEKIEHDQMMAKLNANVLTINEIRKKEGLDPVEWGDQPMSMVMQDKMAENEEKSKEEEKPKEEKPKEEDKEKERTKREETKEVTKQPKEEKETRMYDDFLATEFQRWEKAILSFIDETLEDEMVVEKSFGDFIQRLFNTVNTAGFFKELKGVISATLKAGVNKAEKQLDIDIGVGLDFDQKITTETNRQLDGFYIDGKEWSGIKGVADDVRKDIRENIVKGINEKANLKEIKQDVKKTMIKYKGGEVDGEVTEGRAMRIARTETNRLRNSEQVEAYKRAKIVKGIKWDAIMDSRTSNLCHSLHGKEIEIGDTFTTDYINKSGKTKTWQGQQPPSHPNCRCDIEPILKE